MSIEAMKQALEALETSYPLVLSALANMRYQNNGVARSQLPQLEAAAKKHRDAMESVKRAIPPAAAHPAPVQDLQRTGCSDGTDDECTNKACARACPALTTPPAAPVQEPLACEKCGKAIKDGKVKCVRGRKCWVGQQPAAQPAPEQGPVAIQQFRKQHCADWYDGYADHQDGGGTYEERMVYTAPPAAQRQPLTDEEIGRLTADPRWSDMETPGLLTFARAIEAAHGITGDNT